MSDIEKIADVVDLWEKATPTQRNFLMLSSLYENDNQICTAMAIANSNPPQWRNKDENFVKLEALYRAQPLDTAMMFLAELYPLALVTLQRAMVDPTMKGTQVDAAKAVHRACVDAQELAEAHKRQPKHIRWADEDSGKRD